MFPSQIKPQEKNSKICISKIHILLQNESVYKPLYFVLRIYLSQQIDKEIKYILSVSIYLLSVVNQQKMYFKLLFCVFCVYSVSGYPQNFETKKFKVGIEYESKWNNVIF